MWARILIGGFLMSHGLIHLALKVSNSWLTTRLGIPEASLAALGKASGQIALWTFLLVGLGIFGVPVLDGWLLKVLAVVAAAPSLLCSVITVNNAWFIAPLAINIGTVLHVFRWR